MNQAIENTVPDRSALFTRVEELEAAMRRILEYINSHQVYDQDARLLIRRTLGPAGEPAEQPVNTAFEMGQSR